MLFDFYSILNFINFRYKIKNYQYIFNANHLKLLLSIAIIFFTYQFKMNLKSVQFLSFSFNNRVQKRRSKYCFNPFVLKIIIHIETFFHVMYNFKSKIMVDFDNWFMVILTTTMCTTNTALVI